jgi:tRNA pseudouridine38-40 synthase
MPTYRLIVEYDGTDFHGWQAQPRERTVAGTLLDAVQRLSGERPRLTAAGRTDAGAHAHGQVAGLTLQRAWDPQQLRAALNAVLPADVSVVGVELGATGFDARRDAVSRTYRYVVISREERAAVTRRHAWAVPGALDVDAMRAAGGELIGTHDFASFGRAPRPGGSTVRAVRDVRIDPLVLDAGGTALRGVLITVQANAFLRGMMRGFASALIAVGQGRHRREWVRGLVVAPSRAAAPVQPAPARGLHQWAVEYPQETASGVAA